MSAQVGSSTATGFRKQWRWLSWVLIGLISLSMLAIGASGSSTVESDGERVAAIASTIRCPQCRGQSVAESDVSIAREIRADIRRRVVAGESDDQIRQVYIDRFGRSIVLTPDASGLTGLVWVVPVIAAGLATAAVALAFQRWRADAVAESAAPVSEADRDRVAKALAEPS